MLYICFMITTIYRIEHKDSKFGPYIHNTLSLLLNEMQKKHKGRKYPTLRQDFDNWSMDMFCAFETKKQLEKWFKGYLHILFCNKFRLVEYKVNKYYIGKSKKQIAFKLKDIVK